VGRHICDLEVTINRWKRAHRIFATHARSRARMRHRGTRLCIAFLRGCRKSPHAALHCGTHKLASRRAPLRVLEGWGSWHRAAADIWWHSTRRKRGSNQAGKSGGGGYGGGSWAM